VKVKPTKEQRIYMGRVAELGCSVEWCEAEAEIHHLIGHRRASHHHTMGLCPIHHRLGNIGVAVHSGKKSWELEHGTQVDHITRIQEVLGYDGEFRLHIK